MAAGHGSEMADGEALHQIGVVAERVGLSFRTIRFYDEAGIVVPSARSSGGFRLYTESDVERLIQVKSLKPLGFSLEETTELMALRDRLVAGDALSVAETRLVADYRARAETQFEELLRQIAAAKTLLAPLSEQR